MNASDPQTDRELMIKIGEEVKRLSESIDRFAEKLENFEEKKLAGIEARVKIIEAWRSEWSGVWKLVIIGSIILGIINIIVQWK